MLASRKGVFRRTMFCYYVVLNNETATYYTNIFSIISQNTFMKTTRPLMVIFNDMYFSTDTDFKLTNQLFEQC